MALLVRTSSFESHKVHSHLDPSGCTEGDIVDQPHQSNTGPSRLTLSELRYKLSEAERLEQALRTELVAAPDRFPNGSILPQRTDSSSDSGVHVGLAIKEQVRQV